AYVTLAAFNASSSTDRSPARPGQIIATSIFNTASGGLSSNVDGAHGATFTVHRALGLSSTPSISAGAENVDNNRARFIRSCAASSYRCRSSILRKLNND